MVDGVSSEVLEVAQAHGGNPAQQAADAKLHEALQLLEAKMDAVRNNPQLSQTQKNDLLSQLNGAKGGSIEAITVAIQTVTSEVPSEAATNSYEIISNAVAMQELSAEAQARVEAGCHKWNLDDAHELRQYTNAMIDEPNTAYKHHLSEQLAQQIETHSDLKAAAKVFTNAPKPIQHAILVEEETDKAQMIAELKKVPEHGAAHDAIKNAQLLKDDPTVHAAWQDFEKTHDATRLQTALEPELKKFNATGDHRLAEMAQSTKTEDREKADIIHKMGDTEGAHKHVESMTKEEMEQAKHDVTSHEKLDPNSARAQNAAAVDHVSMTEATFNVFQQATMVAIKTRELTKGVAAAVQMTKDFDNGSRDHQLTEAANILMADPKSAALLKAMDPKAQSEMLNQFVDNVHDDKFSKVASLSKGMSGMVVREMAKENHVVLDGHNKADVGLLLMKEGAKAMMDGDEKNAKFWAEEVADAFKRNGLEKSGDVIGAALKQGATVGTSVVNAHSSLVDHLSDGMLAVHDMFASKPETTAPHPAQTAAEAAASKAGMAAAGHAANTAQTPVQSKAAQDAAAKFDADYKAAEVKLGLDPTQKHTLDEVHKALAAHGITVGANQAVSNADLVADVQNLPNNKPAPAKGAASVPAH